ncbi:MAG: TetR/AcrR family transcriptional regulator C-terminal domain-containing protein [Candidatus Fimadaptatus sp.]|jgi:probable dihydroxyacetone kinase regulator
MPDSSLTKRALAQAIKQLMNEKPLVKISIADIVERCQMNRQSFYYHFRDKYDLVNWIFYTELITELQRSAGSSEWDVLGSICRYLYANRSFYINALKFTGQNSFYEYFGEVIYQLLKVVLSEVFDDGDQSDFSAMFYADALRACIYRWLTNGAKVPPDELVRRILKALSLDSDSRTAMMSASARAAINSMPWD